MKNTTCGRKTCVQGGASFQPERGCSLEKRCGACRILYPQGHKALSRAEIQFQSLDWKEVAISYFEKPKLERAIKRLGEYGEHIPLEEVEDLARSEDPLYEEESFRDILDMLRDTLNRVLTIRERRVIEYLYGLNGREFSRSEVATMMNISVETVNRFERTAITKLKHPKNGRPVYKLLAEGGGPISLHGEPWRLQEGH